MSTNTLISKKLQTSCEANDDKDFISKLPESVVCHILSLLPSKECVRTFILSKDWEKKWTFTYNINVNDSEQVTDEAEHNVASFVKFMDTILNITKNLRSFHLSCTKKYDASVITGWISTALKWNIESIQLLIYHRKGFVLPYHLLDKPSLRKLILKCTFKVPRESYFPNLTYLHLYEVKIKNEHPRRKDGTVSSRDRLVFTFPVLKTLILIRCKWLIVYLTEIHSPALSSFTYESGQHWDPACFIKIRGAKLAEFEYFGKFPVKIDLNESIVLNAYLQTRVCHGVFHGIDVRELLVTFSGIMSLQLSASMCRDMAMARMIVSLPSYDKLQRLVMYVERSAKLLFELLHSAPSLKFLQIHGASEGFICEEVDSVPSCVVSHLEEVMFRNTHKTLLIHLATFVMKNGAALKKVHIKEYDSSWKKDIRNRLSSFPRASSYVVINFISSIRYIH